MYRVFLSNNENNNNNLEFIEFGLLVIYSVLYAT